MPKYYCDYCDIFLTHDSVSVRRSHNTGWRHKQAVERYYDGLSPDKIQDVIDLITDSYANSENAGPPPVFAPVFPPGGPPPPGGWMHPGGPPPRWAGDGRSMPVAVHSSGPQRYPLPHGAPQGGGGHHDGPRFSQHHPGYPR